MRYNNLLIAFTLSVIMCAAVNPLKAQQNNAINNNNNNNVQMNAYTYTPVLYQRGTSTADMRVFPNPARNTVIIYINSIKDRDNGVVVIYDPNGTPVYKNTLQTGNNSIDLGNFSNGIYTVKIFNRDRFTYTRELIVQK